MIIIIPEPEFWNPSVTCLRMPSTDTMCMIGMSP